MKLEYLYRDQRIDIQAESDGDGWLVRLPDGSEHRIQVVGRPDGLFEIVERLEVTQVSQSSLTANRIFRIAVAQTERGIEVGYQGDVFVFSPVSTRTKSKSDAASSGALTAPMVGVVADVLVAEGEHVEAYQPLAVVEAMKVMATLEAPFAGVVVKVHVQKGDRVGHGASIVDVKQVL